MLLEVIVCYFAILYRGKWIQLNKDGIVTVRQYPKSFTRVFHVYQLVIKRYG